MKAEMHVFEIEDRRSAIIFRPTKRKQKQAGRQAETIETEIEINNTGREEKKQLGGGETTGEKEEERRNTVTVPIPVPVWQLLGDRFNFLEQKFATCSERKQTTEKSETMACTYLTLHIPLTRLSTLKSASHGRSVLDDVEQKSDKSKAKQEEEEDEEEDTLSKGEKKRERIE